MTFAEQVHAATEGDFLAWLTALPEDHVLFEDNICRECPVARFYTARLNFPCSSSPVAVRRHHPYNEVELLPDWARQIVRLHDNYAAGSPTIAGPFRAHLKQEGILQ